MKTSGTGCLARRSPPLRFSASYYGHRAREWCELANSAAPDAPIRLRILQIAETYARLAEQAEPWECDSRPTRAK